VPDFSAVCRRQKTLAANIPYRGSKGPLHLPIPLGTLPVAMPCRAADSTGIEVEGEGTVAAVRSRKPAARNARKHGGPERRIWLSSISGLMRNRWRFAQSRGHWRLPLVRKS